MAKRRFTRMTSVVSAAAFEPVLGVNRDRVAIYVWCSIPAAAASPGLFGPNQTVGVNPIPVVGESPVSLTIEQFGDWIKQGFSAQDQAGTGMVIYEVSETDE